MTFHPVSPVNQSPLTFPGMVNLKDYGAAGNGTTDDSTAVQNWLTAIAASGGNQGFVPPGTYLIGTTPALTSASNVAIFGSGRASVFKAAASTQPNLLQFTNCSHIVISNLAMNGNKANVTQLATQYLTLAGIWMAGCDDITIDTCWIDSCYSSGIMFNGGCTNAMISNCRMTGSGDNQIYIRAKNVAPYTVCSSVTVMNCVCSGGAFSGIQGLGSNYLTFTGNVCYSNGPTSAQGNGLGSEGCNYVTMTGNVAYSNGIQGIQSRFTNETGTSQQSTHVVIADNIVYNHTSSNGDTGGIGINDTDDVLVTGNLCYANYQGININGGNGLGVSHAHVASNTVRSSTNAGIRCAPGSGSDYMFEDNYVTDSGADNFITSAPVFIVGGNYLRAANSKEGIHLTTGSGGSVIRSANISNNTDNGVLIDAGVGPVDIHECWFNGSGSDQIRAVQEQATGGPTYLVNSKIQNQSTNRYVFNNASSVFIADQSQTAAPKNFQPGNPGATTSLTLVMMGMGSTVTYTPSMSGLVQVTVTTGAAIATGTTGIGCGARYGTGTAPVNGAAVTGTRFGSSADPGSRPAGTGNGAGVVFAFTDLLSLTVGTAYWFDLALLTGNAADAASINGASFTLYELP